MSSLSTPTLLADAHLDSETSDAYLLSEFVSDQDEAAFAALVKRHGGLVRGVCRRILSDPAAADDAFQHTFLSLSQHAPLLQRTVAPTASLGSWLYRVAVNASLQLKRKARSRRRTETLFAENRPAAEAPAEPWNEVLPALDEEISALPGQYRSAVVKCHLEGKTQQDAAKELGITYATLRRRLKAARGMLRNRLSERGFAKNGFLLIPLLAQLFSTDSVSAESATAIAQTVLSNSTIAGSVATASTIAGSTVATGTTAAAGGTSLAWGAKLLAFNPLVKSTLAGVLMFGVAGSWWILRPDSPPDDGPQQVTVTKDQKDQTAGQNKANPQREPAAEDENLGHFAYIVQNGQTLTPEFENAVQALDDSPKTTEVLELPELQKSREILDDITLGHPHPAPDLPVQLEDRLEQENQLEFQVSAPNQPLVESGSKPTHTPLTPQDVMEILNEQQNERRGAQYTVGSIPSSSQFFGVQSSEPAKTLKVIALP